MCACEVRQYASEKLLWDGTPLWLVATLFDNTVDGDGSMIGSDLH